jgi:hypothetical protein
MMAAMKNRISGFRFTFLPRLHLHHFEQSYSSENACAGVGGTASFG